MRLKKYSKFSAKRKAGINGTHNDPLSLRLRIIS